MKRLGLAAKSARVPEGEEGSDHISLLSDHILIKILSLLPLVEAAKTSILSKRWRYLWISIPTLDFTDFFVTHSAVLDSHGTKMEGSIYDHTDQEAKKFISIFYQIFNFRQAPVHGCSLPIFDFKQCLFDLNNFLLFLYKLHIQHLILRNVGRLDNT